MKDLFTILMMSIVMFGAFMYLLIGTFPPFGVTLCIVAVMVLWLMKGVLNVWGKEN